MVKRKRGKAMSMPAGILAGAGAGLASAIAGAVAAGNMLDRMWISMDSVGYAAMVIGGHRPPTGKGLRYGD